MERQNKVLQAENRILRDSIDLMELAIEDWKALPLGEHFELVAMIDALSRVEAAILYKKELLAWLEPDSPAGKEKPRPQGQGQI